MRTLICGLAALAAVGACGQDSEVAALPVADAGFDLVTMPGSVVLLDGRGSLDPGGGTLSFEWRLVLRPTDSETVLQVPTSAQPSLPTDVLGAYLVELTVSNGRRVSVPDLIVIHAENEGPTAVLACGAPSCTVLHDRQGRVRGDDSFDPENDALTFAWQQITDLAECQSTCPLLACSPSAEPASLVTPTQPASDFIAPDVAGAQLVFALTIDDGRSATTDCLAYTTTNTPPIVAAPLAIPNQPDEGTTFNLQATVSDVDSAPGGPGCPTFPAACSDQSRLGFLWEQIGGTPAATINSPNTLTTTVTAPTVSAQSILQFRLTVTDGVATVTSATVLVTVRNVS